MVNRRKFGTGWAGEGLALRKLVGQTVITVVAVVTVAEAAVDWDRPQGMPDSRSVALGAPRSFEGSQNW